MASCDALARIAEGGKEMLSPADVAPVLGCNPYAINVMARQDPARLGFPVCRIGNRVKIPRRAFLRWAGWEEQATGMRQQATGKEG